jgi:hypothetical protein
MITTEISSNKQRMSQQAAGAAANKKRRGSSRGQPQRREGETTSRNSIKYSCVQPTALLKKQCERGGRKQKEK